MCVGDWLIWHGMTRMTVSCYFRIEKLAQDICKEFGSGPLVALCVLKGGYQFFSHLVEYIDNFIRHSGKNRTFHKLQFIAL